MTEIDAHLIAAQDVHVSMDRLGRAENPRQAEQIIWSFIAHRARGLGGGIARGIIHQLEGADIHSQTLTERITHRVRGLLSSGGEVLEQEDLQALLLWLVGSPEVGPGYLQQVFKEIPDQATSHELLGLEDLARQLRSRLYSVNSRMQAAIRSLPAHQRRLVQGVYDEALIASESGDGERARSQLIWARRMVRRLVDQHRRTYGGPQQPGRPRLA